MLFINTTVKKMHSEPALPLHIDHLHVMRKGNMLLSDIDYTIDTHGVTVILGPNGAGKSLLLQAAHGLVEPNEGYLKWNKQKPQPQQSWRALVFQKPVLLRRSVRANIEYVLSLHKIEKSKHSALIHEALDHTGLVHLANRNARVLSGGEKQRLSIARAWVLQPKVILLDEPTAELDPVGTAYIEKLIKTITNEGTKILMTTHDLGQAQRLANDILFLHQGKLLEFSSSEEFFTKPTTTTAQNFIEGKLLNGD